MYVTLTERGKKLKEKLIEFAEEARKELEEESDVSSEDELEESVRIVRR